MELHIGEADDDTRSTSPNRDETAKKERTHLAGFRLPLRLVAARLETKRLMKGRVM